MNTLHDLIAQEEERQQTTLSLIASENYAPATIRQACASMLMNKYAEGYPGKRYYAGCTIVDEIEQVAITSCLELFGAAQDYHANVQPHSGSQANLGVYQALLQPGDTIMGLALAHGGHLTHGHSVNSSGHLYKSLPYTVDKTTHRLDYDAIAELAHTHKPRLIIAGASSYAREIDFARMAGIAHDVGAYLMADIAHIAGLVAAGLHPSPVEHADIITSTTHKTLRGPRGGLIMCTKTLADKIDRAIMPGTQGGPFMNIIAAKALCFSLAQEESFKEYQKQIIRNAQALAAALVARGYTLITQGTDTHLLTIDLTPQGIPGQKAEELLETIGITSSRSTIPYDPRGPRNPSGLRLGTPAVTTRGMQEKQMQDLAELIDRVLKQEAPQPLLQQVHLLCEQFPIPV
jgi:glycine hydroxymethyltransferase